MKFFNLTLSILLVTFQAQAKELTPCEYSCFEKKYDCNIQNCYTYNTCDDDLFACQASCNSGKKQNSYAATLPIDVSFHPRIEIDSKVLTASIRR